MIYAGNQTINNNAFTLVMVKNAHTNIISERKRKK